jgi:hydroxypyruvate isomerase
MPRFAANVTLMYAEHPFLDRFGAAARDGFRAIECQYPYEQPAAEIKARLDAHGLTMELINVPPGERQGDRGVAALPGREDEFKRSIGRALEYARVLGCPRLHVLAGPVAPDADRAVHRAKFVDNLRWAAVEALAAGVTAVVEPINRRTIPNYLLNRQDEAHAICREVDSPALKVQMDLFHCQIVEGDVAVKIREYIGNVAHMQVAGVPDRHEPDEGELNYPYLFKLIDELGYAGWIGCEYRPRAGTSEGLGWVRPWL